MNFLSPFDSSTNPTTHRPNKQPQLPFTSGSPSPTSSTSSFFSLFDSPTLPGCARYTDTFDRRESEDSTTSWGSMGEGSGSSSKPPDDVSMDDDDTYPTSSRMPFTRSLGTVSSSGSSSSGPSLSTPDLASPEQLPPFIAAQQTSPSSSTTSTAPSKGESTPRAEIPPPVWPLAATNARRHDYSAEPLAMTTSDNDPSAATEDVSMSRKSSLKRGSSWRRKHASLDTPPTAPHLDPGFPGFTALRNTPPLTQPISAPGSRVNVESKLAPPVETSSPDVRRLSGESYRSNGSGNSVVAQSPTTGCEISAPKPPPAGYPLPSLNGGLQRRFSSAEQYPSPSTTSTSSSSSSSKSKKSTVPPPPPPKWACPPSKTNAISGRALSFGSSQDRPDVNFDDFDPELFEGSENEWIEIIKGAEGRIAIKSTAAMYDIMVWLPGFSLDNITIATRGHRTIHIVADQWDEGDHAQWDIKLGEDANLKSVNAKFTGKELRVTVAREQRYPGNRVRLTSSSRPPMNGSYSSPSITSSTGNNPLDRATMTR
ncbi:hypothetical protein I316_03151 [Kwoniella heveanensis BCC8398]|uniref:SHSP domain-containing protein n=1 Tax=Kwoniella heveanensis BCC8398 TaxID=1296120 RepID=A0A1B9GVR7_9TREE|nr:hypothetical protein I316_03151 [Kwoniella heveanensis BCC8398]